MTHHDAPLNKTPRLQLRGNLAGLHCLDTCKLLEICFFLIAPFDLQRLVERPLGGVPVVYHSFGSVVTKRQIVGSAPLPS